MALHLEFKAFAAPKVIVNCARRSGDAKVESRVGQEIFWLPMTEANMQEACRTYLKEYGDRLLEAWWLKECLLESRKRSSWKFERLEFERWSAKEALEAGKVIAVHCF